MTKKELIEALEALNMPDDTPVLTGGFDEDYIDDVNTVCLILAKFNVNTGHCSPHDKVEADGIPAIFIDWRDP